MTHAAAAPLVNLTTVASTATDLDNANPDAHTPNREHVHVDQVAGCKPDRVSLYRAASRCTHEWAGESEHPHPPELAARQQ